ncbi:DUF1176 domain-containing protein [Klebsiella spallanzanii]|uniref:DUF1176 domain-containing protein n=1 Tax=Klebsiella spallanzanii TaxID=2587528 RepID=UPI00115C22BF|nr:DUF1176 domain-containing protein [Klebsiella spallanzanii]VUS58983.1 hypothetical protein SB6419_03583 [Klebsiella spallanzanii]
MLYRIIGFLFFGLLPTSLVWAAPAQQLFSDWLVTCNNQNFCVARNVGLHHGLVMTLTRSAGAATNASLRIELGGVGNPVAALAPIAPRLQLDGKPLALGDKHWQIADKLLKTDDSDTIGAFLHQVQTAKTITLENGLQTLSLQGLKAALLFIDNRQKRVGSETAWVGKGEEPPLSVPPAPALRLVTKIDMAQSPLSRDELNDLMDYGNERMNSSACSLDPFRREVRVAALTDDKVLLMTSCEAGAYNTIWLAWLVSRQRPYVAHPVRLTLPFQPPGEALREVELVNASYDDRRQELVALDKGRASGDCGTQTRWRYDGQRFSLVRYAQQPQCDNWQGPDAWPTLWVTRSVPHLPR